MADNGEMTVAERLAMLGVALPPCPAPLGIYLPAQTAGNLVFTSGMLPLVEGELAFQGPVGEGGLSVADGAHAARLCAANGVAAIAAELGGVSELDRIAQVVQVVGHVLSAPGFADQPMVLNGASEWLAEIFGAKGRHTRMALGAAGLPKNASVEVALVVRLRDD